MLAGDFIKEHVKEVSQSKASVLAHIDEKTWFHVHKDEELPTEYMITIHLRKEY